MSVIRPDLLPTAAELGAIRAVAAGTRQPDLVIRGGRVLSVHTGEFLERDVVVSGRHIAAVTPVGRMSATRVIDASGCSVVPTFIDAHLHIEYTMLTPGELARLVVPRGTTTVLTDADCMANVNGMPGIDYMGTTRTPLRIFDQITPTTPMAPALEQGGARITEQEVLDRLAAPRTVTLGEGNPFDYSERATNRFRAAMLQGRRITGHTGRQESESLWGYLAAGVADDHNAATLDEVLERVRLGVMVTVMSGSMNDNIPAILGDLDAVRPALGHMCFCADDKHVLDLATEGHIDHGVRSAITAGVDPATAYRMATWQPAVHYRLDHLVGAIAPARLADLQLIPDVREVRPSLVLVGGEVVAQDGAASFENTDEIPGWVRDTVHIPSGFGPDAVRVPASGTRAHVQAVEMVDGYFKRGFIAELPVVGGSVVADPEQDVLKVAVVNRHGDDGPTGVGFVRGFSLRAGALAVSSNCANMNIAVVGTDDAEIVHAVRALHEQSGGFVAVRDGRVVASVPLPIGGLMGEVPWERTAALLSEAHIAAADLGCSIRSPYMVLSFVGLVVVPEFGLSDLGLVDVARQELVQVVLTEHEDAAMP